MAGITRPFLNILSILIFNLVITSAGPSPRFKCVTWNVNGVEKLRCKRHELNFLASFDVVLLQETYSGTNEDVLNLEGFIPHHQLGRLTTRRTQWGVSTFFRIDAFAGGVIRRIPSPVDWMVVSRWQHASDVGLIVANVYNAIHSDCYSPQDTQSVLAFLSSLRNDFPADGILLGGDLNVDRWRVAEQRNAGCVIPTATRLVNFTPYTSLLEIIFLILLEFIVT
jgi:exonuclease III